MNQIPCVPQTPIMVQQPQYCPVQPQQPSYNAVKIDVHNPSVSAPAPQYIPQYEQPTAPIYAYPQAPIYAYPQPQQAPVCYPGMVPQQVTVPAPTTEVAPVVQQAPAVKEPVVVPPVVPAPVTAINQQNINAPVVASPQEVKAPVQEAAASAQKPEIVASEPVVAPVDLNGFIAKLANPDFDVQVAGMEDIAGMVKGNPEKASVLLDTKIFDALNNIIAFDSSSVEGPTKEQLSARAKMESGAAVTDAEKTLAMTPTLQDKAERNKSYALFTTAIMDKLYADEISKLSNNTVPLTELPGIANLVNQLKDNPNPIVRASALDALSYIQAPAYKQDLTTLFTVAKKDKDPGVSQAAELALQKLNEV